MVTWWKCLLACASQEIDSYKNGECELDCDEDDETCGIDELE